MWLSGLDLLDVDDSRETARWMHHVSSMWVSDAMWLVAGSSCDSSMRKCYEEALDIARKQVADGAAVVDVNMDDGLLGCQGGDGRTSSI